MKKYVADELSRFLEAIDSVLDQPTRVVVIGGTAAALRYGVKHPTSDIDTWNRITGDLERALIQARRITGLDVPVSQSGQAEGPENMEARFERVLPHLSRLHVEVPERHDLVLMKTVRGYQHDLDMIAEIHQNSPLDLQVLIERFAETDPVGPPQRFKDNFLAVVERLFPDDLASVEAKLSRRRMVD